MIFVLFIAIITADGQTLRQHEPMVSLEACEKAAAEIIRAGTEFYKHGISVGCHIKLQGEPS